MVLGVGSAPCMFGNVHDQDRNILEKKTLGLFINTFCIIKVVAFINS